jgi:hypothetical protein
MIITVTVQSTVQTLMFCRHATVLQSNVILASN